MDMPIIISKTFWENQWLSAFYRSKAAPPDNSGEAENKTVKIIARHRTCVFAQKRLS